MQTAVLNAESKSDLDLLISIARKIGIKAKILSDSEMEEIGLINAIKIGRTNEFVDTDTFLSSLRK